MPMLTVTPEAKAYLSERGKAVSVRMVKGQGGCCSMLSPVIEAGTPSEPQAYQTVRDGDFLLYLQSGIDVLPGGITVDLQKCLWIKRLYVHGLSILP
ncbi:MAG: CC/Se motif family (seleno)protein [Bacillota bacterium]|nr:CC/Se motif family (seleno)protein [Bacillota bacterium]MDW7683075.1 CC/Se motif family (seleno)protein [Bacillota bacterium]